MERDWESWGIPPRLGTEAIPGLSRTIGLISLMLLLLLPWEGRGQAGSRGGQRLPTPGEVQATFDEGHALLVGASQYQNWSRLEGVNSDLMAVQRVLEARGFRVEPIVADPTFEQLLAAVRGFLGRYGSSPRGRLLIYFAGHGHSMRQEIQGELGYLVPVDAPLPSVDPTGFRSKAVSMYQVRTWASEVQARHMLFVFDACFAGSVFEAFRTAPPDVMRAYNKPTRQFITSGSAREAVPDKSRFRRYLVKALEGEADLDRDHFLTGTELGLYLRKQVAEETQGQQNPQFGSLPDISFREGDFVFWLPDASPIAPADQAWLVLNSRPASQIRVDGSVQQVFPVKRLTVRAGTHLVRFELEGLTPLQKEVTLLSGQTLRCVARFELAGVECQADTLEDIP